MSHRSKLCRQYHSIMLPSWLSAREAVEAGCALADRYPPRTVRDESMHEFLQRAVHELRSLKLNFYKRVRFASAFKWRLLENGVKAETAAELTQTLLLHGLHEVTSATPAALRSPAAPPAAPGPVGRKSAEELFRHAVEC